MHFQRFYKMVKRDLPMHPFMLMALFGFIALTHAVNTPIHFNPIWPDEPEFHGPFENVALQWAYTALQLVRFGLTLDGNGPKLGANSYGPVARAFAIRSKCELDAWTQAARPLLGNTVSGSWIQASFLKTSHNINTAVNYANYRALTKTFGTLDARYQPYIDQQLLDLGGSLSLVNMTDPSTPHGLGNLACLNVFEGNDLDHDGSNALGNVPGYPTPYEDYTNFKAFNDPMLYGCKMNCSNLRKGIDVWSPALIQTAPGQYVEGVWADNHFSQVRQFAQRKPDDLWYNHPESRNRTGTREAWLAKNADVIDRSAHLGDEQKALGNFWGENQGYGAAQVSVYFPMAALIIKAREKGKQVSLEDTVKLIFATTHALYDAIPLQYSAKVRFQAARPVNTVQCLYAGQNIKAWKGPYQGVGMMDGSDWSAYQSKNFCFPPTPEYLCGHCSISTAAIQAMSRFFNNDTVVSWPRSYRPGQFSLEPKIEAGQPGYIAGVTNVPNTGPESIGYAPGNNITVSNGWVGWTWDQLGFSVGDSRVWWGVHFNESNVISHAFGKVIGDRVFEAADLLWRSPRLSALRDFPIMMITASGKDRIIGDNMVSSLAHL